METGVGIRPTSAWNSDPFCECLATQGVVVGELAEAGKALRRLYPDSSSCFTDSLKRKRSPLISNVWQW
jgi:hypothetical protein